MAYLQHRRKAFRISQVFQVNEDFEGTGTPAGFTINSATVSFDETSGHVLDGQAAKLLSASGKFSAAVTNNSVLFAKCEWEIDATSVSQTRSGPGFRNAASSSRVAIRVNTAERVTIRASGSDGAFSTTFAMLANTRYFVWLDWVNNGTSFVGISSVNVKPTSGTDTSTAWALTKSSSNQTITQVTFDFISGTVSYYDNVQVSNTEIA